MLIGVVLLTVDFKERRAVEVNESCKASRVFFEDRAKAELVFVREPIHGYFSALLFFLID